MSLICSAADLEKDIQAALSTFQKKYNLPGATSAFVLPDETVGATAIGFADIEARTPMTTTSRMLAASIGKTYVAAMVLALAYNGVLDLDSFASKWLGEKIWFARLPNHAAITLRHLLTHSSGVPDHFYMQSFTDMLSRKWHDQDNFFSPEILIDFILDQPPLFEPGKGWHYTDTGYILVGLIIEAATGKRYYDLIKERFLVPLKLTSTEPSDHRLLSNLAAGYMAKDNAWGFPQKTIKENGELAWNPAFEWTGGGLMSNSPDIARWGWLLYEGRAMQGKYLNELLNSVPISPDNNEVRYGAGVAVHLSGPYGHVYGHDGWIPGYSSRLRYYPEHRIAIAFQLNTDIGIIDKTTQVMSEIEACLADIVIKNMHFF